jgi:hypothetical protein
MKATIGGKRWEIVFTNCISSKLDGDCYHPNGKPRKIRIRKGLSEERELEILIHEFLHAALWIVDETIIEQTALELQRILTERGYHR